MSTRKVLFKENSWEKKSSSYSSSQNPKQHEKPSSSSNTHKSIFTLNNEILILNRFLDFKSETGQNTMTNYTLFYDSFKELLRVKHTQKQFRKRIWNLKQKYEKMKKEENQKFLLDPIMFLRRKYLTFLTWFGDKAMKKRRKMMLRRRS